MKKNLYILMEITSRELDANLILIIFLLKKNFNVFLGDSSTYKLLLKKKLLSPKKTLWSNFAGAAKKFIPDLSGVPTIRGLRYFGPSKMPIIGLIIHSMSIIASFKYQVLFRSLLLIFLFSFLYLKISNETIFLILNFLIGFFCMVIFFISKRENSNELKNCQQRIKNIQNIHTTRL